MNFIKKKIKGSKKNIASDDDDLDPNLFHVPQTVEGAPKGWVPYDERIDEESEEWQAFRQLTQRVTDTLQKTQQNLSKIVASSAVDETGKDIKAVILSQDIPESVSGIHELNGFASSRHHPLTSDSGSFRPERPPPPRPPPPRPSAPPSQVSSNTEVSRSQPVAEPLLDFDLGADFGFGPCSSTPVHSEKTAVPSILLTSGSLFLDDDYEDNQNGDEGEQVDPFDTSFVGKVTASSNEKILIPGVLQFDEDESEKEGDENDPFIIKDSLVTTMDPFETLTTPQVVRAKSPNPFMTDSGLPELSSSNPFAVASESPSTAAPNPFADLGASNVNLEFLDLGFATVTSSASDDISSSTDARPAKDDILDIFGTSMQPPASAGVPANPFVDYAQSSTTVGDLFSLEDDQGPGATSVSVPPRPPPPIVAKEPCDPFGDPFTSLLMGDKSPSLDKDKLFQSGKEDDPFGECVITETPVIPELFIPARDPESSQPPPPRPPPPTLPPARPPPPTAVKMDPVWGEELTALGSSRSTTIGDVKDLKDPFSVLDDTFDVAPKATTSLMQDDPQEKVEFEPIPETVVKTVVANGGIGIGGDPFDFLADPTGPRRKPSLESDAMDFFVSPVVSAAPLAAVPVSELPRPPSVDVMDSLGDDLMAGQETLTPQPAPDLMSDGLDFLGTGVEEVSTGIPPLVLASSPMVISDGAAPLVSDSVVPFTDADTFDAFEAKFQNVGRQVTGSFDPFADASGIGATDGGSGDGNDSVVGFGFGGVTDEFDPFFAIKEAPAAPKPSPATIPRKAKEKLKQSGDLLTEGTDSDSDDDSGPDFSVFIRPKMRDVDDSSAGAHLHLGPIPALAPPPKSPGTSRSPTSHTSPTPRFNPFDKDSDTFDFSEPQEAAVSSPIGDEPLQVTSESTPPPAPPAQAQLESPGSPLFEADDTEPLEEFEPRVEGQGWELLLRQPSKKKLTGQRFWKKVWVTLSDQGVVHLRHHQDDRDAFQELPLQACYSLSEIGAQHYDAYGKIFTVKLQYVFYRERVGVRPGQISRVAQGHVTSLGQLAKLGLPLEHAPQVSQLLKLGGQLYTEVRQFSHQLEDALFRLTVHRDRALTYKTEEVQVTVVDELKAEVGINGQTLSQVARVRVFVLAFITGMPDMELGLNDLVKQGKEVVGRHDIIPVVTEEWIRLEGCEFHSCVMQEEFEKSRSIK